MKDLIEQARHSDFIAVKKSGVFTSEQPFFNIDLNNMKMESVSKSNNKVYLSTFFDVSQLQDILKQKLIDNQVLMHTIQQDNALNYNLSKINDLRKAKEQIVQHSHGFQKIMESEKCFVPSPYYLRSLNLMTMNNYIGLSQDYLTISHAFSTPCGNKFLRKIAQRNLQNGG